MQNTTINLCGSEITFAVPPDYPIVSGLEVLAKAKRLAMIGVSADKVVIRPTREHEGSVYPKGTHGKHYRETDAIDLREVAGIPYTIERYLEWRQGKEGETLDRQLARSNREIKREDADNVENFLGAE